ncbi:glycosyltransferase [Parabacteroides sp. merdae-related_45_40]|uniref:glycosyltransferase n=1 Tax=Parabacteroides sp. merdae-related_45_40 TaxID=1897013 RepID=UPI000A551D5D|nr:glycosyltransferase [Parabacteroides sp. merdae-related_45_40]
MKKKILFIYGQLNGGGAERVLLDILHNIDYSQNEVDLCQIIGGGTLIDEVPKEVNIISLWNGYTFSYKLAVRLSNILGCDYLFKRALKKKIIKSYDLEISFLEGFPLKIHAMMDTTAKKVTWVHCDLLRFPYTDSQFRAGEQLAAYNKMDTVVCVANDTKKAFEQRFPTCTSKVMVIYNPIDREKILKLSKAFTLNKNGLFAVITSGRLTLPKKMDRILRVAKRFKEERINVRFQIIGDGELKQELMEKRRQLDVEDMVEFLGFQKNPFPYIKQADMMFCCSGYEGFCLVICEAMCLGVPVVSTKTSGPIEILDNNQYGLLCEHDDKAMYEAVKRMYEDKELRDYYSRQGEKRILDFSPQIIVSGIDKL